MFEPFLLLPVYTDPEPLIQVGSFKSAHGIKGGIWVYSHTDPINNIYNYRPWYVAHQGKYYRVSPKQFKAQGQGLVTHIEGFADRTAIECLVGLGIWAKESCIPTSQGDNYYWRDLIGLHVIGHDDMQQPVLLGEVAQLFETGANDVMVLKPCAGSVDNEERMVPWHATVIVQVDMPAKRIVVNWMPDY